MIEIIIGLLLLVSGNGINETEDPQNLIAISNNEFSFKIFNMLSKEENDVMSSLSILSALGILMNGAKGQTQTDLKRFLQFKNQLRDSNTETINEGFQLISLKYQDQPKEDLPEPKPNDIYDWESNYKQRQPQLNMANRVIHNQKIDLLSGFTNVVKHYFKGDVQTADFENNAVEETNKINEWIRNKTNNKIEKIFDKLESDTSAVIINALYFKGSWDEEFSKGLTKKMDFYNNGMTSVQIDTMANKENYNYVESSELDSQILEMDYVGNRISFVIVLPNQRNGLKSLKDKINAQSFERAIKSMTKRHVEVFVPKFKVENSYDLMKVINPKPIALTGDADLSAMSSQPLIVDEIQHKVFIEVDEKGTEAAAVTAIRMILMSGYIHRETLLFKADHPFLYYIRDKTNSMILFSGQINKL